MRTKCIGVSSKGTPCPEDMGQLGFKQKGRAFLALEVSRCSSEMILRTYNEGVNPGKKIATEKGALKYIHKFCCPQLIPKLHTQRRTPRIPVESKSWKAEVAKEHLNCCLLHRRAFGVCNLGNISGFLIKPYISHTLEVKSIPRD